MRAVRTERRNNMEEGGDKIKTDGGQRENEKKSRKRGDDGRTTRVKKKTLCRRCGAEMQERKKAGVKVMGKKLGQDKGGDCEKNKAEKQGERGEMTMSKKTRG